MTPKGFSEVVEFEELREVLRAVDLPRWGLKLLYQEESGRLPVGPAKLVGG